MRWFGFAGSGAGFGRIALRRRVGWECGDGHAWRDMHADSCSR